MYDFSSIKLTFLRILIFSDADFGSSGGSENNGINRVGWIPS